MLDNEQRFLTKSEVTRLREKTKVYEVLKRAKYVYRRNGKYYIQKGQLVINKNNKSVYSYNNDTLPMRYNKITAILEKEGIIPDRILNGFDEFTGELLFKSIYDEDQESFDDYLFDLGRKMMDKCGW